jgi:hypothetical protein
MRIIYAASNKIGSNQRIGRLLKSISSLRDLEVKIAAYNNISNTQFDWNLNSILNFRYKNENVSYTSSNYNLLVDEIINYNPDLIISELEIYINNIAVELGIPYWNVSPILLYYALDNKAKYNLDIYKKYSFILNKNKNRKKFIINSIDNAEKNFIYTPYCECDSFPKLSNSFLLIRPNYFISQVASIKQEYSIDCNYEYNKSESNFLEKLSHSDCLISNGDSSFIGDAIYNKKKFLINKSILDLESIINFNIASYISKSENNVFFMNVSKNNDIKFFGDHLSNFIRNKGKNAK